ncbi:MAG: type II toxin-antitoxin system HicA family toxin [Synergistaceae bacterium]|nr:type II toxin-antitoxin system HicA family toxin [Synergistaceae bacterium]MBQ6737839.1 type II toxin-antitoxin system HicA family toxin [Synergistaceae bacterium]MBR0075146.1 type II toxin-antitoxin system HicA family toxin [Synergistaceae bacterium]MBR0079428.1 type II toxin-antitoxin system HicA family toxin [Synergistaceae bacterium]MBR0254214.1 type II toxin-antitoxin system HicA family toxin [Synergistaceae bacterium]
MKKSFSSSEVIKRLKQNGWYLVKVTGDHHQFKHQTLKGKVTIPHPKKNLNINEIKSIEKQSKVKIL